MTIVRHNSSRRRGFTLIEVLATMMLMAIVLPVIMRGISMATRAASSAKRRTEAAALAEAKLGELISTGQWQNGSLSGDFGADWPGYRWQAQVQQFTQQDSDQQLLQELDVHVTWNAFNEDRDLVVSTLIYTGTQTQ
jgi:general secretion pathway protein I